MKYMSVAIAALFVGTGSVSAQQVAPSSPATAKADDGEKIDVVTVTARRREESLQDVPVAVTTFSGQQLKELNVQNLGDLDGKVPNLTVFAARGNNSTITAYIRGIGQPDPLWGVDPGVGIYLDDVYIARPQGGLLDVFDVQRIEILRGPQGTLYGKNTIGGAIKYVSNPLRKELSASVSLDVGNFNQRDVKASIGGGTDDGVIRGRVSVASLQNDGFGKNLSTGNPVSNQDTRAARASIGFYPIGIPFTLVVSADRVEDNSGVRGGKRLAVSSFAPVPLTSSNYDINSGMPDKNFTNLSGASATATWLASSQWTLKSITSSRKSDTYTTIDFDMLPAVVADVFATYKDKQKTQEFQATYDSGSGSSGVIGAYYFKGDAGGEVFNNFLNRAGLFGQTIGTVYTKSTSLYGDWSQALAPRWTFGAGLRFTDETKRGVADNRALLGIGFTGPFVNLAKFDKSTTFRNYSPKLSLEFKASDATNLYASAARGFKSGGYNVRANTVSFPASANPFKDEIVDTYEVGSKSTFAGGKLLVNSALFYTKYKNVQLSIFTSFTNAAGVSSFFGDFTNAGKAHAAGLEVEFVWKPVAEWTINGHVAALNTRYDEYITRGVNVADGQSFANAPRFQGGINIEHQIKPAIGESLRMRVGYKHQSHVYPTTDLSPAIGQDGYGVLGAGLFWKYDKNWSFSLLGSNLLDKEYRTNGYNIGAFGILTGFYGPPRQYRAGVTYNF